MFISNNCPSFHLWRKENLVKHREASKYYETNCPVHFSLFLTGNTLFKIVSLSWNLVPSLIWTCRIQWWWSFFSVLDRRYPFGAYLVQKFKIVFSKWKFIPRLIWICGGGGAHFICFRLEISFFEKFGPKNENYQFKLILILIRIWRIQWWCSIFYFRPEVSFFGKIFPKKPNLFDEAEKYKT